MSVVLALETATGQSSIALRDGDRLIFELSLHHGRDLSRILVPALERCFELSGRSTRNLDAVACSVGPGSFTGLRIGVTAAKTLAFSLALPCVPVSTLHALALSAPACDPDRPVVPILDARRGELFTALFGWRAGTLHRLSPDSLVPLGEFGSFIRKGAGSSRPLIPGSAVTGLDAALKELPEAVLLDAAPQARCAAELGQQQLGRGDVVSAFELAPAYLRRSYAEEAADARSSPAVGSAPPGFPV